MQVSVEPGEGLVRRMHVEIPFERVQGGVDKRLQELSRTIRLPGFRPGKVPLKVVRQRFGGEVEREIFGDLVQSSLTEALATQALRLAGTPRIDADVDRPARRYAFTATFEILPEIEPISLIDKVVKRPAAEVTESDLDAVLESLREQRKTWVPVDRPAQGGDRVIVSFTATCDGEAFEGGSATGLAVELGSGRMLPGFEDGLVGAAPGESRTLDLTFPNEYHRADLRGRAARFEVKVEAVIEALLPALDAAFAQSLGVTDGDLGRLRDEVRANVERELKQRIRARIKESVMDLLVASHPVEVPAVLLASETQALKDQMRETLGAPPSVDLPDRLFEDSARRRVTLGFILGEVIRQQGLRADPSRVRAAVEELASTYESPKEVIDYYYAEPGRLAPVESLILEEQVVDWVLTQVRIEDEPLTFADITAPAAAGAGGAPAA